MTDIRLLTPDELVDALFFDPETGQFSWRVKRRGRASSNGIGSICRNGYLRIAINGRRYLAHRLAWAYCFGEWPDKEIDHINGNRLDNRIVNLRAASVSQNRQNRPAMPSNKSGLKGAHFVKSTGTWRSVIVSDGKQIYLGIFQTAEQAHEAYVAASAIHHKRFSRTQ